MPVFGLNSGTLLQDGIIVLLWFSPLHPLFSTGTVCAVRLIDY